VKLTNTKFKLIIDDIVDLDPLMEYEADLDLAYAGVDLETGDLPPK
jgi:hypothetical protein